EYEAVSAEVRADTYMFLSSLPYYSYLWLSEHPGLVVAHAGILLDDVGKTNGKVKSHCLYGEVNGQLENGYPKRGHRWTESWQEDDVCVYGHTPNKEPHILHNTVNIDTGCVFGNKLTAFRYPEWEFVSVPAK